MKILDFIESKIVTSFANILFVISCLWMLVESLSRQFFNKSYSVSEEVVVFTLIWAIFLTLGQSGKEGNHIFVDLIVTKFSQKLKKVTSIINSIIGILYAAFLVYVGINYMQHLLETGITSHSSLRLPMGYVFLVVPIGMLFFGLYYVRNLVNDMKNKQKAAFDNLNYQEKEQKMELGS